MIRSPIWFFALVALALTGWGGCRFIGENQKVEDRQQRQEVREMQSQTATVASGAATVKEWAPAAANGRDAAVTIGANAFVSGNIIYAPVFNAPPEQARREVEQKAEVDAKSKTAEAIKTDEKTEKKATVDSVWYYVGLAFAAVIFTGLWIYWKTQLAPAWNFAKSKAGGLRVFGKADEVISDHQGKSTDPAVIAAIAELKQELRDYKTSLQLKKRSDD